MNWWSKTGRRSPPDQKSHPNWVPSLPGSDKKPKSSSKGPGSCYAPWNDKFQPTVNKTVGTSWDHWWKKQKGTPPGPTNHILAILLIFTVVIFFFIFAVINKFYWKDMYICIHFIKYTHLFHFPGRIYTSMCFSDATPGGVEKKHCFFGLTPPPLYIFFVFFCYPSPGLVSRNGTAL